MINSIALVTSLNCNLKCNYCHLTQDKEKLKNIDFQKANIQALQDGTFLKNVKKVLIKLHQVPELINQIAFWGMEPTLTLKYITEHIKDWFNLFPNWNVCYFTTNGQSNIKDIYDFAEAAAQYSKTIFQLQIQVSYDGHEFTKINRQIKKDNYLQLFQNNLSAYINNNKQNNFYLKIYPHGVITADIIKYLNSLSIDELYQYFINQNKYSFTNYSTPQVQFRNQVQYNMEYPYKYTSQDGKNINELLIKMLNSNYNILQQQANNLLYTYSSYIIQAPKNLIIPINKLVTYCGNYTERLYFRYDGIIMQCENLFFKDKFPNYPLTKHHFFYNIEDNIENLFYDNYWETLNYNSNIFQYENIQKNIQILAKQKEIDPIYLQLDNQTLDQHIRYIMFYNSCFADYYQLTNSALTTPLSHIELFGNGLCFLIDNYINKNFQEGISK